jgi:hypothetical protein
MTNDPSPIPYKTRVERLPSFDLVGFTKIVASGGDLYEGARRDGRWEALLALAGEDGTIYGVASVDKECPKDHYRYTLAVAADPAKAQEYPGRDSLFRMHIKASQWLIFAIEHFNQQYGAFWGDDPYKMTARLGWAFNTALGLHIDAFPPGYAEGNDAMEFMMPVKKPA